jgi:diguanylate cyclase (GGDEF)-like protein
MTTTRGVRASRESLEPPNSNGAHVFDLAERLAGLWHLVNRSGAGGAERVQQLLDFSTRSLRPDRPFVGLLTHLSEGTVVVDAASFHKGEAPGMLPSTATLVPGSPFPFDATVHRRLFLGRRAHSWNDLARADADAPETGMLGWRALIGTSFQLGSKTTFLVFGSPEPCDDAPFTENDYAFIDVLASIVANRLQEDLMRDRLRYQIEHDLLTGLPNRVQFLIALRNAVSACRPCAIALADLDDFNAINKINGQSVGDDLLAEIGSELAEISEFDFVARVSGDRFAMLIYDVETEAEAAQHVQAYQNRFLHPFHAGDGEDARTLSIGSSFGMTLFPIHGVDAEDLMRRALFALEVAKRHGGGRREFFRQEMEDSFQHHRVVRNELLAGVEADQFSLVYQPTFDLATGAVRGAEALIRWNHPHQGLLLPGQFIPVAEQDNEAIGALGRWVMARAVRDLATLERVPAGFCCYINVSPLQLREQSFFTALRKEIDAAPHVAACLGVEVTESAAMENIEQCIANLAALRELGLRVALDDFGTGYSSLSQLKRMPLNVVKIDQSFVRGLPSDPHDAVLCEAMISIADRFGFATLAEGIETPEQAAWLLEHGCRFGQGYFFGRPAPWADLERRLLG